MRLHLIKQKGRGPGYNRGPVLFKRRSRNIKSDSPSSVFPCAKRAVVSLPLTTWTAVLFIPNTSHSQSPPLCTERTAAAASSALRPQRGQTRAISLSRGTDISASRWNSSQAGWFAAAPYTSKAAASKISTYLQLFPKRLHWKQTYFQLFADILMTMCQMETAGRKNLVKFCLVLVKFGVLFF